MALKQKLGIAALAIALAGGYYLSHKEKPEPKIPAQGYVKKNGSQKTGALANLKLAPFEKSITGLDYDVTPLEANVEFNDAMNALWSKKLKRSKNNVCDLVYNSQVCDYLATSPTKMTIDDYLDEISGVIKDVNKNLDWKKVQQSKKGFKDDEIDLTKKIAQTLNAKDILSYGMTELLPSHDGKRNMALIDFMLRNGGREYVELIPALYDAKTSFGLFQFTEYALFDANGEKRGASIINQALPKNKQIPGSVSKLKGDDHIRAAYLFSINNIADLINGATEKQKETLSRIYSSHKGDIVKYIATAHHGPSDAKKIARRWLDNGGKYNYSVSCNGRFRAYAKKTGANQSALYSEKAVELKSLPAPAIHNPAKSDVFSYVRKNSKGYYVFKHEVSQNETLKGISKSFNKWDGQDRYHKVSPNDMVDMVGHRAKTAEYGKDVYVLAKRK